MCERRSHKGKTDFRSAVTITKALDSVCVDRRLVHINKHKVWTASGKIVDGALLRAYPELLQIGLYHGRSQANWGEQDSGARRPRWKDFWMFSITRIGLGRGDQKIERAALSLHAFGPAITAKQSRKTSGDG